MMAFQTPPMVMDTNVLVAGACRHVGSFAYRMLMGVLEGEIPLMLTQSIALEYLDVLQRPRVLLLTGLDHRQSAELVTVLIAVALDVQIHFSWRPNLTDESDNKFVEAAMHTGATIVSYNALDYRAADLAQFGYSVMAPQEFALRYLRGGT